MRPAGDLASVKRHSRCRGPPRCPVRLVALGPRRTELALDAGLPL